MGKRRNITLAFLTEQFFCSGYVLLSPVYKTNKTSLRYACDKGHVNITNWSRFNSGHRCPECAGLKKKDYYFISKSFKNRGFALVSEKYENAQAYLEYVCPSGHCGKVRWNDFRRGDGCSECAGVRKKSIEEVKRTLSKSGYTLLSEAYIDNKHHLDIVCENGHSISMRLDGFISGNRCSVCTKSGPVSRASQEWLDSIGLPQKNREVWLPDLGVRADGFDPETNTAFEFLGDYWHGNPVVFCQASENKTVGKTFGQLFDETIERLFLLRRSGYNLNIIWESDFNKGCTQ